MTLRLKSSRALVQVLVLACAATAVVPVKAQNVAWLAPTGPDVSWRGMQDASGGGVERGGALLYPAIGFAGFLAAVLTHAVLMSGVQSSEQNRQRLVADAALSPYSAALLAWPAQALWEAALALPSAGTHRLTDKPLAPADSWLGQAAPSYVLASVDGALMLDVGAKLTPPGGGLPVEVLVRVLSTPLSVPNSQAYWEADNARALKGTAAAMLAHALQLAVDQAVNAQANAAQPSSSQASVKRTAAPGGTSPELVGSAAEPAAEASAPFKTHRYLLGRTVRSERSQLVSQGCERVVLRTLRGWLLSAPVSKTDANAVLNDAAGASAASAACEVRVL